MNEIPEIPNLAELAAETYCILSPQLPLIEFFNKMHEEFKLCLLCEVAERITGVTFSKIREAFPWMDKIGIRSCIWSIGRVLPINLELLIK